MRRDTSELPPRLLRSGSRGDGIRLLVAAPLGGPYLYQMLPAIHKLPTLAGGSEVWAEHGVGGRRRLAEEAHVVAAPRSPAAAITRPTRCAKGAWQRQAVELRLAGKTYAEIGAALGVSRGRAEQLVRAAQRSGKVRVHLRVVATDGVDQELVAAWLRRVAERDGLTPARIGTEDGEPEHEPFDPAP